MTRGEITGYPREDGRLAARNHVLVLPSVVCATRVARDVAAASDAVTVVHQLGCSQVGDDAARTALAFEGLATNPNVGAVVVISLGCETIQGRQLAERIRASGQRVAFVGIQDVGGSERAEQHALAAVAELAEELAATERRTGHESRIVVGVEAAAPDVRVHAFLERALAAGAAVVAGERAAAGLEPSARRRAFQPAAVAPGLTVLDGVGEGPQQHAALAVAGAHVIVSFPAADAAPVGCPVCPVIAVAGSSPLHDALRDDFDAPSDAGADALWALVVATQGGAPTTTESWGSTTTLALERLAMTL